ncbi:UDP-N-acetylmuramate--L-alanine ligase [Streptomyces sp. NPDC051956]|uniref:UDP-N-acetylmuramate--L-alanine ligase n=1 Tax=Streptomyces sp. NPDC051956 TaxID=3365677 RepID=UPI0037D20647
MTELEMKRVHFVGIGGAGMSGIARILLARGVAVSGSDAKESAHVTALRELGATVHVGHDGDRLGDADTVVVSNAIKETNPEVRAAHARGLRVIPRAAALGEVMAGPQLRIAVAGTAGKSSTSGMLTVALRHGGIDPSFAVGASVHGVGSNAHQGSDPFFVAEADESDSSFLLLSPEVAVITNIGDDDHLDLHGTAENYARVFEEFADRVPSNGVIVTNADDPGAQLLARYVRGRVRLRTFGESPEADLRLTDITVGPHGTTYRAVLDGVELGPVRIAAPGRHMALNSAAALLAGIAAGLTPARVIDGLAAYQGVYRRFESKGSARGIQVYDDYAHNPTKVREQLRASKAVAAPGRLIVVFQPPLFSSAQRFPAEFGAALGQADQVLVMDISRAREEPIEGVTGALVAKEVPLPPDDIAYCPLRSDVLEELTARARPGDLVLTVGTGDVTTVGPEFLALLGEQP